MNPKVSWILYSLILLGLSSLSCRQKAQVILTSGTIIPLHFKGKDGKVVLNTELALTRSAHRVGLMKRTNENFPYDRGMLFVFEKKKMQSFWMKNTLLPLSIAFIDEKGVIFQIEHMKPHDLKSTKSVKESYYVLETHKGWFQDHGIEVGAKIENFNDHVGALKRAVKNQK